MKVFSRSRDNWFLQAGKTFWIEISDCQTWQAKLASRPVNMPVALRLMEPLKLCGQKASLCTFKNAGGQAYVADRAAQGWFIAQFHPYMAGVWRFHGIYDCTASRRVIQWYISRALWTGVKNNCTLLGANEILCVRNLWLKRKKGPAHLISASCTVKNWSIQ